MIMREKEVFKNPEWLKQECIQHLTLEVKQIII